MFIFAKGIFVSYGRTIGGMFIGSICLIRKYWVGDFDLGYEITENSLCHTPIHKTCEKRVPIIYNQVKISLENG